MLETIAGLPALCIALTMIGGSLYVVSRLRRWWHGLTCSNDCCRYRR